MCEPARKEVQVLNQHRGPRSWRAQRRAPQAVPGRPGAPDAHPGQTSVFHEDSALQLQRRLRPRPWRARWWFSRATAAPEASTRHMAQPQRGSRRLCGKSQPALGADGGPSLWGPGPPRGVTGSSRLRLEPLGSSGGAEGDRKEVIRRQGRAGGYRLPVPNSSQSQTSPCCGPLPRVL